jgi:acetylornithine deacetylase
MAHVDVAALHKQLIRFPSLSGDEGPIADYIEEFVSDRGVQVGRQDDNVYFWIGEGDDTLLLNSHLDVVPPSSGHPHDPFDPVERDGRIYGRGSVDAKASVASMTGALLSLEAEGWRPQEGRVIVALTTHEETGGVYNGLENLRPHLPALTAALVGEPTDLEPCVAQKGLLILTLHARGETAHAARPHLGDNAILKAARDVGRLESFQFESEDSFLGSPTITVTTIEGGSARNVVPDRCTFTLDIRTTPGYSHDELYEQLSAVLESDIEIHSKRIVPVSTPLESRIVRASIRANPGARPFGSPTASDWIFLHDVPTVKIGPGSSDLSHTAEESIPKDELRRGAETYRNIIKAYFTEQDAR